MTARPLASGPAPVEPVVVNAVPDDGLEPTMAGLSTRLVRLRNALLAQPGEPGDFDWAPPQYPPGFRREAGPAPAPFLAIVRALELPADGDDWARAQAIATHLNENLRWLGPVQSDLLTTYRALRAGDGYCSDAVRVFLALAHAAGLHARQWSFAFDGYGGHGHTLAEVYDTSRRAWLMLDVYNNFHPVDAATGEPLSALAFRAAVTGERPPAAMRPVGHGPMGLPHAHRAIEYYARGAQQWYLHWGNAVFTADADSRVRAASRIAPALGHLVGIAVGTLPRLRLLRTPQNDGEVRSLVRLRTLLLALPWLVAGLAVTALVALRRSGG